MHHLTRIEDIDNETILSLFEQAERFRTETGPINRHSGRIVATLFYEPSTRTRLSFESAALRLGAQCIGFSDPAGSSASKGETLIDTIRTVQRYADLIVLRHGADGAAALAAKVATVPIVNAGDGSHQHPSQTLFDLYTIWQRFGSLDGRTIGLAGDLRYGRTVHSLAVAAARMGASLVCIAPDELQMPAHLVRQVNEDAIRRAASVNAVIGELDVLYITRVQRERMDDAMRSRIGPMPPLTRHVLTGARPNMMVLHPLPRVDEIDPEVDEDPRGMYFEQLANGVVMRMALLDMLLTNAPPAALGARDVPQRYDDPPWRSMPDVPACGNARCVSNSERGIAPRREHDRCAYCGFAESLP